MARSPADRPSFYRNCPHEAKKLEAAVVIACIRVSYFLLSGELAPATCRSSDDALPESVE